MQRRVYDAGTKQGLLALTVYLKFWGVFVKTQPALFSLQISKPRILKFGNVPKFGANLLQLFRPEFFPNFWGPANHRFV